MTSDEILTEAKRCLSAVADKPYPAAFEVSPWWTDLQTKNRAAALDFSTLEAAITQAQAGVSGFDHRQVSKDGVCTINFKLAELGLRFPAFNINDHEGLSESHLSLPESIVTSSNGKRISSIFLTHLYFYLRTQSLMPAAPKRILEIGSGYGGLARIYKTMTPDLTYVLVDLPESLFYAQLFLTKNMPDARIFYVEDHLPPRLDDYDFVLVPAQAAKLLVYCDFDLVVNTGSLQEMTTSAVHYWMRFIQSTINTKAFYSWNYFFNDKTKFNEVSATQSLISPVLDSFWIMRYFRINDSVLTVDCDQRNWLEVFVDRIPSEEQAHLNRLEYANMLVDNANSFRTGTNYWFASIWMSIWVNPAPSIIDAMLAGIDLFEHNKTFGVPNHLGHGNFGETKYYKKLRSYSKD